jgi:hypothetical protein
MNIGLRQQKSTQKTVGLHTIGPNTFLVGWPFLDGIGRSQVHGFALSDQHNLFYALGNHEEMVRRHFPCETCACFGFKPEDLVKQLPLVLPVM